MIWIEIEKNSGVPIIRQIYNQICEKILKGELKGGDQLPSTRELATFFNVSRNVVLEAYEMLLAEGYTISKPNVGTFVAEAAVLDEKPIPASELVTTINNFYTELNNDIIDFRPGVPALDLIPRKKWIQIRNETLLDSPDYIFGYGFPEGRTELRNSICRYLQRTRGLNCHPDQVVITSSSVQSFSILSRILLNNTDSYILEDPLHVEIKKVFTLASSSSHSIPVDNNGIQTALLPKNIDPKFIFVTPSHQYPLGGTLPIQRRIELIQYARSKDCYIIEDDYDSEYRYTGSPVSSLQGLDPDHVIYAGTFSKVMFPSIRLAYVILPWSLVNDFREYKRRSDYFTNITDQLAMSKFIDNMLLDRHISKMKKIYHKRRNYLIDSLNRNFGSEIKIHGESTGLHLICEFSSYEFSEELVHYIYTLGVGVYPVWVHSCRKDYPNNLVIMGYSHLDLKKIESGVILLCEGLKKWKDSSLSRSYLI